MDSRWSRSHKALWYSTFLAVLAIGAAFAALVLLLPESLRALQLNVADVFLIREGGPLLGNRPVSPAIILVLNDEKTYKELGEGHPRVEDDLDLYAALLAQGARVVADTRVLFEDTPGVKFLLDGMVSTGASNRLLRDVRAASATWFVQRKEAYLSHVAHELLRFDAGYDESQYIRYYPLLGFIPGEEFYETMALKVARAALHAAPATDVPKLARDSGIAAAWVAQRGLPLDVQPPRLRQAEKQPQPYPLGASRGIPWVLRPSKESPALISPAALWINYGSLPGGYPYVSYVDTLKKRSPEGTFRDKVAIIGDVSIDTYPVPTSTSRRATAAEVVAHAVQTIVEARFLQPVGTAHALAIVFAMSAAGGIAFAFMRPWWGMIALVMSLGIYLSYAIWLYRSGLFPDLVLAPGAFLSTALVIGGYRYAHEEVARRRIYDLFGRYVPRAVVEDLVQKPVQEALALGGVKRDITVLFADVRGFTAFSERLAPDQVLDQLNALLQLMVKCAFQCGGTVDKYIGDAIMVLFNAPMNQTDHEFRAVRAALEMQEAASSAPGRLPFGIGIHTGEAVVGNIGTKERMEYTAIGSTVNLAARLCDTAGAGEIVISEDLYARLKEYVQAEARLPIRVKGIEKQLVTYRLTGLMPNP